MKRTYEYSCQGCREETVERLTLGEYLAQIEAVRICPKCNGIMERKITAGATVMFTGDQWPDKRPHDQKGE